MYVYNNNNNTKRREKRSDRNPLQVSLRFQLSPFPAMCIYTPAASFCEKEESEKKVE